MPFSKFQKHGSTPWVYTAFMTRQELLFGRPHVMAVDWSADSHTLRSTCQGYEILHFDAPTGRQAVGDFRDAAWDTWTAPLGFPVMGVYQVGWCSGLNPDGKCCLVSELYVEVMNRLKACLHFG